MLKNITHYDPHVYTETENDTWWAYGTWKITNGNVLSVHVDSNNLYTYIKPKAGYVRKEATKGDCCLFIGQSAANTLRLTCQSNTRPNIGGYIHYESSYKRIPNPRISSTGNIKAAL